MRLGDRIIYSAELLRVWREPGDLVTWEPVTVSPRPGVIVGTRTLSTGRTERDSEFDDWSGRSYTVRTWRRLGSVAAVLVAYDMRRSPIYVPPSAIWYCPSTIVERLMRPRLLARNPV